LLLATTTSTQDSGLLDALLPLFHAGCACRVKVIAVGSGEALAMGRRGDADVLLVHSPEAEARFMAEGHGARRLAVMHNDFVLLGPAADPAGVRGAPSASEAFRRIAARRALFVSRGDRSGTHARELALWKQAGLLPAGLAAAGSWYKEAGVGMGDVLRLASERGAYTLSDRGTFLALRSGLALSVLYQGDAALLNPYHVIEVSPTQHPRINPADARAFADFLVSPATQAVISAFGRDRHGEPLFVGDAAGNAASHARPSPSPLLKSSPAGGKR
jgi:tungstate transport system substrate-binding protein